MKKQTFLIFLFFIFLISSSLVSAHYWDFITIGQGDNRWCRLLGTCEISNLIVKNLTINNGSVTFINKTVVNINVTGNIIADNFTGFFNGNNSQLSRSGTDVILTNIGDNVGIGTNNPNETLHISGGNTLIEDNNFLKLGTDGDIKFGYITANTRFELQDSTNLPLLTIDGFTLNVGPTGGSGQTGSLGFMSNRGLVGYDGSDGRMFFKASTGRDVKVIVDATTIAMLLDSSGNVGIGTTTPTQKLEVNGSVNISGGNDLYVSDDLFVTDRVGIGTNNPTKTLHVVQGSAGSDTLFFRNNGDFSDLTVTSSVSNMIVRAGSGDSMQLTTNNINTQGIRITSDGNVGIGTTSPTQKLDVNGSVNVSGGNDLYVSDDLFVTDRVGIGINTPLDPLHIKADGSDNTIRLEENSGTEFQEFRVDSDGGLGLYNDNGNLVMYWQDFTGQVGIGTTPSATLHIQGTNDVDILKLRTSATWLGLIPGLDDGLRWANNLAGGLSNGNTIFTSFANRLKDHDHSDAQTDPTIIIHSATDPDTNNTEWGGMNFKGTGSGGGYLNFETGVGDIALMPISNVGIGTTAPKVKLDVKGDTNISGNLTYKEIYGEMHFHVDNSGVVIPIPSSGIWVNITAFNGTGTDMTQNYTNGFTFDSTLGALICDFNMRVSSTYHISTGNAGNNQEYQWQLAVNNVRQHITDAHRKIGSAGDVGSATGGGSFNCNNGDVIQLQTKNVDGTADLLVHVSTVVLRRIG